MIILTADKEIKMKYGSNKKTLVGPLQQFPIHKYIQQLFYFNYKKSCSTQTLEER